MPTRPRSRSAILAAALVAGCVTGQPTTVGPASGAMTVDQLGTALAGSSIVATKADGSGSYCAYHDTQARPGGSMMLSGTDGGVAYRGLWRVEPQPNSDDPDDPGFVCYSFPDAGVFAECRMVRVAGPQVSVLTRSGQPYASGELRPGNACGGA